MRLLQTPRSFSAPEEGWLRERVYLRTRVICRVLVLSLWIDMTIHAIKFMGWKERTKTQFLSYFMDSSNHLLQQIVTQMCFHVRLAVFSLWNTSSNCHIGQSFLPGKCKIISVKTPLFFSQILLANCKSHHLHPFIKTRNWRVLLLLLFLSYFISCILICNWILQALFPKYP